MSGRSSVESEDYVFVGDDGVPLPPEEATSLQMHADVVAARRARSTELMAKDDGDGESGMCVTQSGAWYVEAQAHADAFLRSIGGAAALDAEAARLFAREATGATDCTDDAPLALPDGATAVCDEPDDAGPGGADVATSSGDLLPDASAETLPMQDAGDSQVDSEDGMVGGALDGYSREYSDGGEWQLERILAMRTVRRPQRRREFLCQWRWYEAPTWEPEAALVDLGFDVELARYLAAARAAPLAATQSADAVAAGDVVAGGASSRNTGAATSKFGSPAKARLTGDLRSTIFERIFPDWFAFIREQLRACDGAPVAVANIAPVHATARFLELWRRDHGSVAPVRVFHGTRSPTVPAICVNGLAVPGSMGVTVRNGQAYGPGIYTARTPRTPMGYTDQYNYMFVCVALLGSTHVRAGEGPASHDQNLPRQFVIFSENFYVVPVWLVQFRRLNPDHYDQYWNRRTPQEIRRVRTAVPTADEGAGGHDLTGVRVFSSWRGMLNGCGPVEAKGRTRFSVPVDPSAEPTAHVDNTAPSDVNALRATVTRAAEVIRAPGGAAGLSAGEAVETGAQTAAQVRAMVRYGRASDGKITKRMLKQVPRSVRAAFT